MKSSALTCLKTISFIFLFCLPQSLDAQEKQPSATLVICPAEFDEALKPWVEFRQAQGYNLLVYRPEKNPYGIRKLIRDTAKGHKLDHILIVGDAHNSVAPRNSIPTDYVPAKVNVQFGSEPEIATDQTFGDLDDDGLPEMPVGRICVDNATQLRAVVKKILDYETNQDFGTWRRRIDLTAGTGGFGPVIDKVIETAAKQMITDVIPHAYETSMTYGSWTSPYCPDPRQFSKTAIDNLNRGGLFWVYIGHGHPLRLDRVQVPGGEFPIFEADDHLKLKCESGHPIGVMLSCYTGAFDFQKDCLAESMVNSSGGPVAMICGTRVTMPYAMSLLMLEMMQDYFEPTSEATQTVTIGQLFNQAKRRMLEKQSSDGEYRKMIETLGKTFSPTRHLLDDELKEHVYLFHLIGDPLLTLKRPAPIELDVKKNLLNGEEFTVSGRSNIGGELKIELVYRRDRMRIRPKRRKEFVVDNEIFLQYHDTYLKANDRVCDVATQLIEPGEFKVSLRAPEAASGDCIVRAYVAGTKGYAIGSEPVFIKKIRR